MAANLQRRLEDEVKEALKTLPCHVAAHHKPKQHYPPMPPDHWPLGHLSNASDAWCKAKTLLEARESTLA